MNAISESAVTGKYLKLYRDSIGKILEASSPYINSLREDAIVRFSELGIPSRNSEAYKYTNLVPFFDHNYSSYFLPAADDFRKAENFRCDVSELDAHGLALINGYYPAVNDKLKQLPGGIWVGSINEAALKFPELIKKHYGRYARNNDDGLVHLNTAMVSDGVFLYVPDGVRMNKPIQMVNLVDAGEDMFNQRRKLIIVGRDAELSLIICDHTLAPKKFLTNAVTEVHVGEDAHFDIIRVQNEHNASCKITHTFIHQERNSITSSNNMTLHGGLVRNNTWHYLGGEHAETMSSGLFLADKFQHIDNCVSVEHAFPDCTSNQLFKGALDDMATGAFNGRIFVRPQAQRTLAYQKNNNILLTNDARMDTKPQLEIFADDVKCSHGAAVGQIDQEAMFYLRSRGIDKHEAKQLLMFGFAHEVIQNIRIEPLRERMDNLVMQRLRGELSRCASCVVKCG